MPLRTKADAERIDLTTPGEWVYLKRVPSKGDRIKLQTLGLEFRLKMDAASGQMGDADIPVDDRVMGAMAFLGLELAIVSWNLTDGVSNEVLPVTPENIRALDEDDYDLLIAKLEALWEPRTKEESQNLSGSGASSLKEKEAVPVN